MDQEQAGHWFAARMRGGGMEFQNGEVVGKYNAVFGVVFEDGLIACDSNMK